MPEKKRFLLRLDPELFGTLERWAADELRSVNGQIEYLLREAVYRAGRLRIVPAAKKGKGVSPDGNSSDTGRPQGPGK